MGLLMFRRYGDEKYTLIKDDVFDCFMLPISNREVIEVTESGKAKVVGNSDSSDSELTAKWKAMFDLPIEIPVEKLSERIKEMDDPANVNDFKRFFVMHVVCTVLALTSMSIVDFTLCRALENVDEISSLDWFGFVIQRLSSAVVSYKNSNKYSAVNACLSLLLLCFFYRFPFQGIQDPLELPLCKDWTSKKLMSNLLKAGYESVIMSKMNFPLSKGGQLVNGPVRRFIQVVLPEGVPGDEEIDGLGLSPWDVATLKFQRLISIATDDYVKTLARLNEQKASQKRVQQTPPVMTSH